MDNFKKETAVGFTVWNINAKCVHSKHRAKDARMVKRTAAEKIKIIYETY